MPKIDDIIKRSSKAVCGVTEREVIVKIENVTKVKNLLKKKGLFVVGESEPLGTGKVKKIWFAKTPFF